LGAKPAPGKETSLLSNKQCEVLRPRKALYTQVRGLRSHTTCVRTQKEPSEYDRSCQPQGDRHEVLSTRDALHADGGRQRLCLSPELPIVPLRNPGERHRRSTAFWPGKRRMLVTARMQPSREGFGRGRRAMLRGLKAARDHDELSAPTEPTDDGGIRH